MRNETSQPPFPLALVDNTSAPVHSAPDHGCITTCPSGGSRTPPQPFDEQLDGVSDALASGLCGSWMVPFRHAGRTARTDA